MEKESVETKKCKNCLKRVTVEHNRCPHCRKDDFIFDGVFIEREKREKLSIRERLAKFFKKS